MELLKVDVSSKWLVHMIHGRLSHLKQSTNRAPSGGVGRMDGMSSERSDLQLGERLLHSPAGVKDGGLEFREPAAERRIERVVRDDEGWCVTMEGVLLVL